MREAYKIMEYIGDEFRTLFHGNFGSRTIPKDVWVDAQIREKAKDGTSKTYYRSGWHVLYNLTEIQDYLSKFTTRLDALVIVQVEIGDIVWDKIHSPSNVILCERMKIKQIII